MLIEAKRGAHLEGHIGTVQRGGSSIAFRWVAPALLGSHWIGPVSNELLKSAVALLADLNPQGEFVFVADTVEVVHRLELKLLAGCKEVTQSLRRSGMCEMVLIGASATGRMMAVSVGFSIGLPIKAFETRKQASRYLEVQGWAST